MRRIIASICLFTVVSPVLRVTAQGSDDEARHFKESAGKFSFLPPEKWTAREIPGLKYRVVVGPARSGFASNINVVDERFKGTLDDYVKVALPQLEKLKKFKIVERGEFKTTSGLRGVRLITENEQVGHLLRQTFYLFGPGDTKYVVTCSTLAEGGAELDPLFEQAMKSFRIGD